MIIQVTAAYIFLAIHKCEGYLIKAVFKGYCNFD